MNLTTYILFAIPPMIAGFVAQQWVVRTFNEASKVRTASGLTGTEVCRRLLDSGGLQVGVEQIGGRLSDHYDPRAKVMRLSQPVATSDSVAAVAVALFSAVVAFGLVTLPVEFGASRRALQMMTAQGILAPAEVPVARKVLTAAAVTYLVAALAGVYQLVLLFLSRR